MLEIIPWWLSALLILVALVSLFAIGMPVGLAMGFVTVGGILLTEGGAEHVINNISGIAHGKVTQSMLVCFPLFVLMTEIMAHGGISRRLIEVAHITMGRFPGSLAAVSIIAATVFGAISGAAAIGVITISDMLLPECMRRNYDKSLISGAIAAGGTLSFIIPPSFTLILWGVVSKEPVDKLFMAGILPGLMIAVMFIIYIIIKTRRNPGMAPMPEPTTTGDKLRALVKGWDIILIIVVVLGGVYSGIATVTEVASLGALTALIIALAHKELSFRSLLTSFSRTGELMASFVLIIIGAFLLIHLLGILEIPRSISQLVIDLDLSTTQLVIAVLVLFFLLGMFIEACSVMLIVLPLFITSLEALNVDLMWLGVLVCISCMIAELTPPVGFSLFVIQGVGQPHGINFSHIIRGIIPFIVILSIALVIIIIVPGIATWLPSTMG